MQRIYELGRWLSTLPYENITKREAGEPRGPDRILEASDQNGTGGTCFSLVNLANRRARNMNLDPKFYLGDRPDGENRHCVIGFPDQGVFLDPGYLCFNPLPLNPQKITRIQRPQNILQLEPIDDHRIKMQTERKNQLTWRYTLVTEPVSRDQFERAWRSSFNWYSVMNSYVMTRLREDDMLLYLNGRLESISRKKRKTISLPDDRPASHYLAGLFGLDRRLLEDANLKVDFE